MAKTRTKSRDEINDETKAFVVVDTYPIDVGKDDIDSNWRIVFRLDGALDTFADRGDADLRDKFLAAVNAWAEKAAPGDTLVADEYQLLLVCRHGVRVSKLVVRTETWISVSLR